MPITDEGSVNENRKMNGTMRNASSHASKFRLVINGLPFAVDSLKENT